MIALFFRQYEETKIMSDYFKNWWRPLWSGLVIDLDGKHSKQMKTSVWLFLYLLVTADSQTGTLVKTYAEISRETGRKEKTVRKWMHNLVRKGYVTVKRRRGSLSVSIKRWKSFDNCPDQGITRKENAPKRVINLLQLGQIQKEQKTPKSLYSSRKTRKEGSFTDKRNVIRDNNNIVNVKEPISFKDYSPKTSEELLALDLAQSLNDLKSLNFYLSVSGKYPEELLRRICNQVKEIPTEKIKKSKGALFTYLLKNTVGE
ncbi:MAG: hypothetical protein ABII89_02290 [Candidatus Omnitrophota bacterium]